jgi:hypothetical protein
MSNYTDISTETLIKMRGIIKTEQSEQASKLEEEMRKELALRFGTFEAMLGHGLKEEFIANGFVACEVTLIERSLEIGLRNKDPKNQGWKFTFVSTFTWYIGEGINAGSSGIFNPSNADSYWHTIHAASILKNYDKLHKIAEKYCNVYNMELDRYFN